MTVNLVSTELTEVHTDKSENFNEKLSPLVPFVKNEPKNYSPVSVQNTVTSAV